MRDGRRGASSFAPRRPSSRGGRILAAVITARDVERAERALEHALDLIEEARPEWMRRAACRGLGHLYFPTRGVPTDAARAICAGCTVRDDCRAFVLRAPPGLLRGIWGGMTTKQRREERAASPPGLCSSDDEPG